MTFLTPAQRKAVDYVTEKSRRDSEAVYPKLVQRVVDLGYSENDLKMYVEPFIASCSVTFDSGACLASSPGLSLFFRLPK